MAFINKELTEEERKAIIDRKIEFGFGRIAHPRFATIDKESYFFNCGSFGCFDSPDDIIFYFETEKANFLIFLKKNYWTVSETDETFVIEYSGFSVYKSSTENYDADKLKNYIKEALQLSLIHI